MKKGDKRDNKGIISPISPHALAELMRLARIGQDKYGLYNWQEGIEYHKLFDALMRHALQFWSGEDICPEDKQYHLASVAFNALALLHYTLHAERYAEFDDRPTKVVQRLKDPQKPLFNNDLDL